MHGNQSAGISICGRADGNLYRGFGDYRDWSFLFAYRGDLLLPDRVSVFVLWLFPGSGAAFCFCGAYDYISWNQSAAGLPSVGDAYDRISWYLGKYSCWMGAGGSDRTLLLKKKIRCCFFTRVHDIMSAKEKQAAAKQTFVFLAPLTSKPSAEQTKKRCKARVCES